MSENPLLKSLRRRTGSTLLPGSVAIPWTRPFRDGLLTALALWALSVIPALAAWVASAQTSVPWTHAMGLGSAVDLLGHGVPFVADGAPVGLVPLGLWLVGVWAAQNAMRRLLLATRVELGSARWQGQSLRVLIPWFLAGYAAWTVVAALLSLLGPASISWVRLPLALVVPVLGTLWALWRVSEDGHGPEWFDDVIERLPWQLRITSRAVWVGLLTLLGAGAVFVLLRVVMGFSTITSLMSSAGAGAGGGTVFTLAQLAYVPNLVMWAVGFVAGPGFTIADGGSVDITGSHPGLMPLVPLLGALPSDGAFPAITWSVLLVPVFAGVWMGRIVSQEAEPQERLVDQLRTASLAALVVALVVTALGVLASGSLGAARLSHVGVDGLLLLLSVLALVGLGALLSVLGHGWAAQREAAGDANDED